MYFRSNLWWRFSCGNSPTVNGFVVVDSRSVPLLGVTCYRSRGMGRDSVVMLEDASSAKLGFR